MITHDEERTDRRAGGWILPETVPSVFQTCGFYH